MRHPASARPVTGVALVLLLVASACRPAAALPSAARPAATPPVALPAATLAVSASPTPAATAGPGYGTTPPGWETPRPVSPPKPLPDPSGQPLPTELIGRQYNVNPPEIIGSQAAVLTLRAADDPHCLALYEGRSTCFTVLWTPNWPDHAQDPAARGSARIDGETLVLGFDLIPNDPGCEGTTSIYAVSADGSTLSGVDVAGCTFPGFVEH
jgi:hypothetical protein